MLVSFSALVTMLSSWRERFGCDDWVFELLFSPRLRGSFHSGCGRLAEEPHESLDVLGSRRQEELLPHELQSPQS
jgi:hypothetical protein